LTDDEKIKTGKIDEEIKEIERFSGDSFWKDLMKEYFYALLKRALPELYADADTKAEPVFLDKEFTDVLKTADAKAHNSPHFADLLVDVPLKDGKAERVLLHLEAQSSGGGNLAERMYFYQCLIYSHYRRKTAAVAIITDRRPRGESRRYSHSGYGTSIDYDYNNLVLSELDDEELMASGNPIDIVLYAAKYAARAKKELQRYNYLRTATRLLADLGWNMGEKRAFLVFAQRIINLKDEKLKAKYFEYLEQLDREGKIVYVTMAEEYYTKKGVEKGIEKGIEKGKLEVARNLLARGDSPETVSQIAGLPQDKIRELMN
jgi:hypothetical protein